MPGTADYSRIREMLPAIVESLRARYRKVGCWAPPGRWTKETDNLGKTEAWRSHEYDATLVLTQNRVRGDGGPMGFYRVEFVDHRDGSRHVLNDEPVRRSEATRLANVKAQELIEGRG